LSDDTAPSPGDILYVATSYDDGTATIVLVGEFDMSSATHFWASVSEALATNPRSVSIEARGLTFIDSAGLQALIRAREAAGEAGVAFRVSEPSPPLRRVVELTGTVDLLMGE
jgi:anti-sigma B factor antagonist